MELSGPGHHDDWSSEVQRDHPGSLFLATVANNSNRRIRLLVCHCILVVLSGVVGLAADKRRHGERQERQEESKRRLG